MCVCVCVWSNTLCWAIHSLTFLSTLFLGLIVCGERKVSEHFIVVSPIALWHNALPGCHGDRNAVVGSNRCMLFFPPPIPPTHPLAGLQNSVLCAKIHVQSSQFMMMFWPTCDGCWMCRSWQEIYGHWRPWWSSISRGTNPLRKPQMTASPDCSRHRF